MAVKQDLPVYVREVQLRRSWETGETSESCREVLRTVSEGKVQQPQVYLPLLLTFKAIA